MTLTPDPAASARAPVAPRRAARASVPGGPAVPGSPPLAAGGKTSRPAGSPSHLPGGASTSPQQRRERAAVGTPGPDTRAAPPLLGAASVRARVQTPAGASGHDSPPAGSTGRTYTIEMPAAAELVNWVRLFAPYCQTAHLQHPDSTGGRAVLCNRAAPQPDGWLGASGEDERIHAAGLPVCRQCLSVLDTTAREASTSRETPLAILGQPVSDGKLREPGLSITPGGPTVRDVGDEGAVFMLRREMWDLPVVARFTIEGEPVSKSRARFTNRGSKTMAYTPEKTHQAEQVIGWKFRQAAPRHKLDPEKTYGVVALFFCGTRQRRDVDNMLKLILDGLNRVAWPDDDQVTEVSAKKTLTLPGHARTEIAVYQIGNVQRFTGKCGHCGRDYPVFRSTTDRQKYCSRECANKARQQAPRQQVTCEGCGETFEGRPGRQKWCSQECRIANGRVTVPCTGCGVEFTKQKCHIRDKNYCSDTCRDSSNREHRQQLAKGTCETCGNPTSKKSYRQCNACRCAGTNVTGKPKVVAA